MWTQIAAAKQIQGPSHAISIMQHTLNVKGALGVYRVKAETQDTPCFMII